MRVTRIHTDQSGESHFDDIQIGLSPVAFAPPAPPMNVSSPVSTAQMVFAQITPGWLGDWHPTPRRQYWVATHGTVEITVSDGEVRQAPTHALRSDRRSARGRTLNRQNAP
jgi:hypothetical protein